MLRRLDSFLIDRVFQPVLQCIMYHTGCRKWWLVAQVEFAQFMFWCCGVACFWNEDSWPEKICVLTLGLLWIKNLYFTQKNNLKRPNENPGVAPIERLVLFPVRIFSLATFLIFGVYFIPLFIYLDLFENTSNVCFLLGFCAWVVSSYFQASSVPKPPEKRNEVPNGVFQGF